MQAAVIAAFPAASRSVVPLAGHKTRCASAQLAQACASPPAWVLHCAEHSCVRKLNVFPSESFGSRGCLDLEETGAGLCSAPSCGSPWLDARRDGFKVQSVVQD